MEIERIGTGLPDGVLSELGNQQWMLPAQQS